jgi:hypothetical protein
VTVGWIGIANSNISPLGEINKIPTPPPLPHEDPSKNKAHVVISRELIDGSRCSVMKSAII